jgi:hypothetical protein
MRYGFRSVAILVLNVFALCAVAFGQLGNAGSIEGTVKDPSGASVPGAKVEITNPVSGFHREEITGTDGSFRFVNVPFNPYHMVVTANGFNTFVQDVDLRSTVPFTSQIALQVGATSQTIRVESPAGDLIETESTFHTDVDRSIIDRLPLGNPSSSFTSLATLVSPGVAADSNGLMHGLGDHAENSVSLDGQPITDQFSKVFSNQLPTAAIESMEIISGAPPAEFGDKTSLVIKATTKSGLGVTTPTGSVYGSYGSFGTANIGFGLLYGGKRWGNFLAANGLDSGRFLDPPEFGVMHDKGNQENVFDRFDYQLNDQDTMHTSFQYTRSWFQNPNTFDQELHTCTPGLAVCDPTNTTYVNPLTLGPLGPTDQRSKIETFNVAPVWTRLINSSTVFTLGGYVRRDHYNYYPSADPFADFAPGLQSQTIAQDRKLLNAGVRSDVSYVRGIHNLKAGVVYQQWFLDERDTLGTVDPFFSAFFFQLDANGNPIPNPVTGGNFTCADPRQLGEVAPCQTLASVDLTAGGKPFTFSGHSNVKETSLYVQDTITKGNWSFNLGIRGDMYNGFVSDGQAEPRLGLAYNIKPSNTVLRLSYARTMETPFNENLIISSSGCSNPVVAVVVPPPNTACTEGEIRPGWRNEFHAGLQQAFGKYLVVDGEYIWKYTHGGYDFGVLAATPIAFPIEWHNSKIPGYVLRVNVPNYRGFSALVVMSGVAARFFPQQVGGVPFLPAPGVFRIDHDEHYNQTTHLQYQPWKTGPWVGFNWRYDSGLVAGSIPCFAATATCGFSTVPGTGGAGEPAALVSLTNNLTGLPLTADQQYQSGLTCMGVGATPTAPIPTLVNNTCPASQFGSKYINIPAPGKENDDHNPQRIAPRHLFDIAVGEDNLFRGDRYRWSLQFTVINLTNKTALYNFFSTFSGTHYVTPRTETVELGFHF